MASPNISFDSIPASIRKPGKYFEFNTKLAVRTLPGNLQRVLMVGQRRSTGSVAEGVPVDVFSSDQAATYFGLGSQLHLMCKAAITANPYLQLSAVALNDAAGSVAATHTLSMAGTVTVSGVVTLNIGTRRFEISAPVGESVNSIFGRLYNAVQFTYDMPVTPTFTGDPDLIILTAKNKGTLANELRVSVTFTCVGLTATITSTAGSVDPTIQTALTPVVASGHNIIITPYNNSTSLALLRTHLDFVSGAMEQRGAIGVYGHTGTLGQSTTLAGLVNSGRITGILVPSSPSLSYEVAAAYGAVIASEEDPARPLNTLQLTDIAPSPLANRLSRTEQESALNAGSTPSEVGPGEKVQIVRAITTYTVDANAVPDISLLDLTTIRTLDYVRKACRERISLRFPREKLSSKTPAKVRSELLDVLVKLEELEIVEEVQANKDGLIVERDLQDPNRLDAKIPCDVVNGLHVFAGRIDLLL